MPSPFPFFSFYFLNIYTLTVYLIANSYIAMPKHYYVIFSFITWVSVFLSSFSIIRIYYVNYIVLRFKFISIIVDASPLKEQLAIYNHSDDLYLFAPQ